MSAAIQYGFFFARGANTWPAETPQDAPQEIYLNPEAQRGLRPSRACAERWLWFRDRRIAELEQCVTSGKFGPKDCKGSPRYNFVSMTQQTADPDHLPAANLLDLLASVRQNNPEQIERYRREYLDAAQWEKSHYGNVFATVRIARFYL